MTTDLQEHLLEILNGIIICEKHKIARYAIGGTS